MDGLAPQPSHYFGDIIQLKKADRGNASRARIKAGTGILERDATQGEDGNPLPASFSKSIEASRAGTWNIFLLEDWSENGEISSLRGRAFNISSGMAGNANQRLGGRCGLRPNLPHLRRRNIVSAQVHTIRAARRSNVSS